MKIIEVIGLDCSKKENETLVYKAALSLPFFKNSDLESLDATMLEGAIKKMQDKYPIMVGYIFCSKNSKFPHFSIMIKHSENNAMLGTIYALCLKEGLAKVAIFEYDYIKNYLKGGQ